MTYYYAGSQRVAMRVQDGITDEVYYLFGDHLGSTSITTDSDGNLHAELRYTAWGEDRYTWGTTPTTMKYTGQREESLLGLYFYNARWYDPYLNRWIQPDSIIPDPSNPLDYDRYAYSLNNPTNYTDPSGHSPCLDDGYCPEMDASEEEFMDGWYANYGIKYEGEWSINNSLFVLYAVQDVGTALAEVIGGTISSAFRTFFRGLKLEWCDNCVDGGFGQAAGGKTITFDGMYSNLDIAKRLVVHEFGHIFDQLISMQARNDVSTCTDRPGCLGRLDHNGPTENEFWGFAGGWETWQFGEVWGVDEDGNEIMLRGEIWADMFVGWTYGRWGHTYRGEDRQNHMNDKMENYLTTNFVSP
jgi:RHS repeat-associated protein